MSDETDCPDPECGICHVCQFEHRTSEHLASLTPDARGLIVLRAAMEQTGIALRARTDATDGHDWVRGSAWIETGTAVVWCQFCGVHRVEVPDWREGPACPALAAVRAALAILDR